MKYKREIKKIFKLALEINEKGRDQVFFQLSPHVNQCQVVAYIGGWDNWEQMCKELGEDKADENRRMLSFYYDDYNSNWNGVKPQIVINYLEELLK